MNLEKALEGYWLVKQRDFSQNTLNDYALTYRRLVDYLGPQQEFASITPEHLNRFLNYTKKKHNLADKTMANIWIALSSLWTWAELELGCPHVIRGRIQRPRYRRPPIEPYTEAEIKAMIGACEHTAGWRTRNGSSAQTNRPTASRDKSILVTLVDTGLRASELCALLLRDYDPKTGRLHVLLGKGRKSGYVFVGMAGRRILWRYLSERADSRQDGPLFATRTGTPLDRNNLGNLIERIAERAGVENATVHRFRHTFAVMFLRNGGNLLELKRLLGHEKMATVEIYVELAQSDLSNAQRIASPADNWRL